MRPSLTWTDEARDEKPIGRVVARRQQPAGPVQTPAMFERILRSLLALGYSISPASLRLDDLTEPIVRLLKESGERSITIAPETGSDRLRRVINKTVTNDEILEAADVIFRNGIDNLLD